MAANRMGKRAGRIALRLVAVAFTALFVADAANAQGVPYATQPAQSVPLLVPPGIQLVPVDPYRQAHPAQLQRMGPRLVTPRAPTARSGLRLMTRQYHPAHAARLPIAPPVALAPGGAYRQDPRAQIARVNLYWQSLLARFTQLNLRHQALQVELAQINRHRQALQAELAQSRMYQQALAARLARAEARLAQGAPPETALAPDPPQIPTVVAPPAPDQSQSPAAGTTPEAVEPAETTPEDDFIF